jgi:sec-independent protein translocase protein TatA
MFGLGISELIIIAAIILLIFGARRLPQIGDGLGKTVREIKRVSKDLKEGKKKDDSSGEGNQEHPDQDGSSSFVSLKDEIDGVPGVREIKDVRHTASEVRKWWRLFKH